MNEVREFAKTRNSVNRIDTDDCHQFIISWFSG